MVTNYESFINEPNLLELSEGVMAKMGMNEFSNLFEQSLFESDNADILLEKAYSIYELGLLYESRKSWFEDETPIYMVEGDSHNILFKNGSLFIVRSKTFNSLNEGFSDAWNSIKATAKSMINNVSQSSKQTWDVLSDGAKKAYEFSKRIISAIGTFVKENALTCVAVLLQILSGVVAFIPAAGQILGPALLIIAGLIEIYEGGHKMKEAWEKFRELEVSKASKAKEAIFEGLPLAVAGSISLALGLNDIITSPKAAIPGVGASSTALKGVAKAWEKTFVGSALQHTDEFVVNLAGKGAAKIGQKLVGPTIKFMENGGTAAAASVVSFLYYKVGQGILGNVFDSILKGMGTIMSLFSSALSLPGKFSGIIDELAKNAVTPIAKIIIFPLKDIVGPVVKFLGKFLDNYIRPFINRGSEFFITLSKSGKEIEAAMQKTKLKSPAPITTSPTAKTKTINADVSKDDLKKVKKLPKTKQKSNESVDYIKRFGEFSII